MVRTITCSMIVTVVMFSSSGNALRAAPPSEQQLMEARDQLKAHAELVQKLSQQLEATKQQLAERELQLHQMARQMQMQAQQRDLPPLEGAQVKVYPLKVAKARDAARMVDSLFGAQALRVAVDEQGNALVVYGKPDALAALDTLINRLDDQTVFQAGGQASASGTPQSRRTLMLRLFWLANGLPPSEGQDSIKLLPENVVNAVKQLGLDAPQVVTQTVTSLAVGGEQPVAFSTSVPALLGDERAVLEAEGHLQLVQNDRVQTEMNLHVILESGACELHGSLATPLEHYMVLGTVNSVNGSGTKRSAFVVLVTEGESFPRNN